MVNLSFYARDEDTGRAGKGRHRRGRNSQVNGPVFGLSSGEPSGTDEAGIRLSFRSKDRGALIFLQCAFFCCRKGVLLQRMVVEKYIQEGDDGFG